MIRQGELRDVPTRGGERTVDMPLQKGTLQSTKNTGTPLVTTPKTLSGEQTDASTVDVITSTSNDTLPHVIAAQILSALDGVRLQVLRLAEMAKESAIARSKLEAIQRALQEDTP
jgi:hypothetical protein